MRFMILIKADKNSEAGVMPDERLLTETGKFNDELVKAGVMLAGEGLHPSSKGARVKFAGGKHIVTDGPFTEAKELIAGGADVKASNDDARGLLHEAAADGRLEVVRALLAAKLEVDPKEEREGATPLMLAAAEGHTEVIQELLRAKANVGATNNAGKTAFEIATDAPGFAVDEPVEALGRDQELPNFLEPRRKEIEGLLPVL